MTTLFATILITCSKVNFIKSSYTQSRHCSRVLKAVVFIPHSLELYKSAIHLCSLSKRQIQASSLNTVATTPMLTIALVSPRPTFEFPFVLTTSHHRATALGALHDGSRGQSRFPGKCHREGLHKFLRRW